MPMQGNKKSSFINLWLLTLDWHSLDFIFIGALIIIQSTIVILGAIFSTGVGREPLAIS